MLLWRLSAKQYCNFDGEGAKAVGGRWNSPGYAVVYTSASVSLVTLEFLAHLTQGRAVKDLVLTSAELPKNVRVERIHASDLPGRWREFPAPPYLQKIGDGWIFRRATAVLVVPSAVIPQEDNYLLNPAHPDFKRIRVNASLPFSLTRLI